MRHISVHGSDQHHTWWCLVIDPDSKVHGANMGGPPGSCRPQMGPMLAPWTLLSGDMIAIYSLGSRNLYLTVLTVLVCLWRHPRVLSPFRHHSGLMASLSSCWRQINRGWDTSHMGLCVHNPNIFNIHIGTICLIMLPWSHNFVHVMTVGLSWYVQIVIWFSY